MASKLYIKTASRHQTPPGLRPNQYPRPSKRPWINNYSLISIGYLNLPAFVAANRDYGSRPGLNFSRGAGPFAPWGPYLPALTPYQTATIFPAASIKNDERMIPRDFLRRRFFRPRRRRPPPPGGPGPPGGERSGRTCRRTSAAGRLIRLMPTTARPRSRNSSGRPDAARLPGTPRVSALGKSRSAACRR